MINELRADAKPYGARLGVWHNAKDPRYWTKACVLNEWWGQGRYWFPNLWWDEL